MRSSAITIGGRTRPCSATGGGDRRAARARSRRYSGLRKRRKAPEQRWPPVLARRARRSTGLLPARRFRPVRRIGVDDLAATLAKVTDDAPVVLMAHEPELRARAGAGRAAILRAYPWRAGAAVRVVADRADAVRKLVYGHARTKCDVIVSGGLGCSIMPFRLGVPPEIVLVTLGGKARGLDAAASP